MATQTAAKTAEWPPSRNPTAKARLLSLVLGLLTLLVYLPVTQNRFVNYDDPEYLTSNRIVQAGLTWDGVKWAFQGAHVSSWDPLTWLSLMLDCELFGLDPGAHHFVSAVLHSVNCALLLWLLFRMTGQVGPSAIVAAMFAWHPLRVETVAWASERKGVLSMVFFLMTLWAYWRYVCVKSPSTQQVGVSTGRGRVQAIRANDLDVPSPQRKASNQALFYGLAILFFVFGLLSKPILVTLPIVLLLLDFWPLRRFLLSSDEVMWRNSPRLLIEKVPFMVLAALACVGAVAAKRASEGGAPPTVPLALRLSNATVSCGRYLLKTVWPVDLGVLYPLPTSWPWHVVLPVSAVLLAVSLISWRQRHRQLYLLFGWVWFLTTLLPVLGLMDVGNHQAMADRYTYIPHIGLFVAVIFSGLALARRRSWGVTAGTAVAVAVLAACILITRHQLGYWRDGVTLFTHTLKVTKDNVIAHIALGTSLEEGGRIEDAIEQYQAALAIEPGLSEAHDNLGNALSHLGRFAEAIVQYRESLRLNPRPLGHLNLGVALVSVKKLDEGESELRQAIELDSGDPRPHYWLAQSMLERGRTASAVIHLRDALQRDPNNVETLLLLARILSASDEPEVRSGSDALAAAMRADAIVGGNQPFVLDTLGIAYAENGRFADAQECLVRALEQARSSAQTNLVNTLNDHLRAFQANQPCRFTPAQLRGAR